MKELFDPDFFRRLEKVRAQFLKGRQDRAGDLSSRQESSEGIEFHDYRGYTEGDDPRYIDWNAFARLGRVFLKRFKKEEAASLSMVLDLSSSMSFGNPNKKRFVLQLAGSLGAVALASAVRVQLFINHPEFAPNSFEGKNSIPEFLEWLAKAERSMTNATTPLENSLRPLQEKEKRQEIFVFTDLLFPEGPDSLLQSLVGLRVRGHELKLIQVLSKEERDPRFEGSVDLFDSETQEKLTLFLGEKEQTQYREELKSFLDTVERFSKKHGIFFELLIVERPYEEAFIEILNHAGAG